MSDVTFLDYTRTAEDIAHDETRFAKMELTSDNIIQNLAEAASEVAGWGGGCEAAVMRFAIAEIIRLRTVK